MGRILVALVALAAVAVVPSAGGAHKAKQPEIGKPRMQHGCARIESKLPTLADWPRVHSRVKDDAKLEARVRKLLSQLTLEEKVGQMTQPEITGLSTDEVAQRLFLSPTTVRVHVSSVLRKLRVKDRASAFKFLRGE